LMPSEMPPRCCPRCGHKPLESQPATPMPDALSSLGQAIGRVFRSMR
jgi:hypothetical protein